MRKLVSILASAVLAAYVSAHLFLKHMRLFAAL